MTFQIESIPVWAVEATQLIFDHWQELGLDLDLEIAPDFAKMKQLEDMGMFKVLTVREQGKMVGYLLALINHHLHYRTSPKMLIVDAYYIAPAFRSGAGAKLIRFTESIARRFGCIKIYFSCKVHKDHSSLFTAMGYRLSDYAFTKRI